MLNTERRALRAKIRLSRAHLANALDDLSHDETMGNEYDEEALSSVRLALGQLVAFEPVIRVD